MRTSIIKLRNAVFSKESLRLSMTSLIDRLSATLAAVQMLCGSVARQRRTRCVKSRASLCIKLMSNCFSQSRISSILWRMMIGGKRCLNAIARLVVSKLCISALGRLRKANTASNGG
ncbi:hypothetical protein D3C72_2145420 [compost metagenome]